MTTKQLAAAKRALKTIAKARSIRNPFVGRAHQRFYLIDAETMRLVRRLAKA